MDIKSIVENYKYKTELHTHTNPVSSCADIAPEEVVRLYAENGAHSMVITNHINGRTTDAEFYLSDYYRALEEGKKCGVDVILGVEIAFSENRNDYLVYGVSPDEVEKMIPYVYKGIEAFYRDFKSDRNVILHAHPFRDKMSPTPLGFVDGIESYNLHPKHNARVGVASKFAREHDLLVSCGTDFHHLTHEAMVFVRSRKRLRDSYDVAELIKSRDYLFDVSGSIIFPYADR